MSVYLGGVSLSVVIIALRDIARRVHSSAFVRKFTDAWSPSVATKANTRSAMANRKILVGACRPGVWPQSAAAD